MPVNIPGGNPVIELIPLGDMSTSPVMRDNPVLVIAVAAKIPVPQPGGPNARGVAQACVPVMNVHVLLVASALPNVSCALVVIVAI
jgi:hypothetical protein